MAASFLGWDVVETAGVSDYQGWGVLLLKKPGRFEWDAHEWAVLAWSYGSCSYCDRYEDRLGYDASAAQCALVFGDLLELCDDEESARTMFDARKGW